LPAHLSQQVLECLPQFPNCFHIVEREATVLVGSGAAVVVVSVDALEVLSFLKEELNVSLKEIFPRVYDSLDFIPFVAYE